MVTMASDGLIPSVRIDAESVGPKHCFDAWRETVRDIYDVKPLAGSSSVREYLEAWLVDNLVFTEVGFSQQAFSHHIKLAQDANYLSLQIYRSGAMSGVLGDQSFTVEPGEVHIFDFSRQFHSIAQESIVAGVIIPHEAIGYDPGKHPAHISFSGNSAIGRFLMDTFFALKNQLPDFQQDEATPLAEGFCSLVRALTLDEPTEDSSDTQRTRLERRIAMRSYLDRRLSSPDLGVDDLLRIFGVSRPTIYRDFADVGGVAGYINDRRLDRAFYQLASASPAQGRIKEIANRLGFNEPAHFSRLFRQRFGITPGEALASGSADSTLSRQPVSNKGLLEATQFQNWVNSVK
ncbi:MAG: AraC family transcriptional regulator [Alphaproteobacteria bacterium]|nr:AraC family transcriptional regulator [Alphaproteobacteria bacterium]